MSDNVDKILDMRDPDVFIDGLEVKIEWLDNSTELLGEIYQGNDGFYRYISRRPSTPYTCKTLKVIAIKLSDLNGAK